MCQGGENGSGQEIFYDRDCKNRCDAMSSCTGYALPNNTVEMCATYTTVGARGLGGIVWMCYMKPSTGKGHFKT